jgi:hypothetical protein
VGASLGCESLPPRREENGCATGFPPPSKASGPNWILAVCGINLCPAVMELGQEGWLKQPVAKVRRPIVAGDHGSCQGHQCGETLT